MRSVAPGSSRRRMTFSGTGSPDMSGWNQGPDLTPGAHPAGKAGVQIHGMAGSWLSGDEDRADGLPALQRTERRGDVGERVDVPGQRLGTDSARGEQRDHGGVGVRAGPDAQHVE